MNTLSIIIVNWNTTEYVLKCLESIYNNPPNIQFEVIVVDNNSSEDISKLKINFSEINLISCKYNYGFGVGTNIGYRLSSSEFVMTLNPDTLLTPDTINELINVLKEDKETAIAVPVLKQQKVRKSQYSFFNLFYNSTLIRKFRTILNSNDKYGEKTSFYVKFFNGTGYICRRVALEKDYIFSENNFLFGEEYYLCRLINDKGYKIKIIPNAIFEHYTSVTFKNDLNRLEMATKLGTSVGWHIRKLQWGNLIGTISGLFLCMENFIKWVITNFIKSIFRNTDQQRLCTICQARAITISSLSMIWSEKQSLSDINEQSEIFFNGGYKPIKPPVFEEIVEII